MKNSDDEKSAFMLLKPDKQHDNLHRESQLSLINFAYRWPHLAPESAIMAAKASMDEIEVLPFLRTSWYTSAFQKDASVLFSLFSSLPHGNYASGQAWTTESYVKRLFFAETFTAFSSWWRFVLSCHSMKSCIKVQEKCILWNMQEICSLLRKTSIFKTMTR